MQAEVLLSVLNNTIYYNYIATGNLLTLNLTEDDRERQKYVGNASSDLYS